jgi:peptidyl-dipeptidase Dcp
MGRNRLVRLFAYSLIFSALPPFSLHAAMVGALHDPFATPSPLPFQYPPFDQIRSSVFAFAFTAAMAEHDHEIAAIAARHDEPTFENVVLALERAGQRLHRVQRVFGNLLPSVGDAELQKIDAQFAPRLSLHFDGIYLNSAIFRRLDSVYRSPEREQLDAESRQLLERKHADFVRHGARLPKESQARLKQINSRLAVLSSTFRQNALGATQAGAVVVEQRSQLDGLDDARISAGAAAASARGLQEKWLLTLERPTTQAVLGTLTDRALRERIYRASISRASAGKYDNRRVVVEILRLRDEKARLLGFPTYAAYALDNEGAATPAAANELLNRIASAGLRATRHDAAELQELMDADMRAQGRTPEPLQPWDWAYYSERARKRHFGFDQSEVKAYFELNRVLQDGVFFAAHELFGLSFKERKDLPTYASDVRVFDVLDANDAPIAIFIADYFARDNKEGGAWMDNYVDQSALFGAHPVVVNNLNLPKPESGQPVLLSFDDVVGLYHEFGHALHGMLSNVRYQSLSGTNVPTDFVEYPSQCNEMWARDPKVLAHFAFHYRTGAAMPADLQRRVVAGQKFNSGFLTSEYVVAAILDMEWHASAGAQVTAANDVLGFETKALPARNVMYPLAPPRYHTTYFLHIFESEDYAAGYYAYLWSEVLARDTGRWIYEHGGLVRAAGSEYRDKVLSRGRSAEPAVLFKSLYGKDPDVAPLIEYRGLNAEGTGM